jgi:hypothetical protein
MRWIAKRFRARVYFLINSGMGVGPPWHICNNLM